jgi:hypothetical protein
MKQGGNVNDWWVIEYDNKNHDSPIFLDKLQKEFQLLLLPAGPDSRGTRVLHSSGPDNTERVYFNAKAASLPRVMSLLLKPYGHNLVQNPQKASLAFSRVRIEGCTRVLSGIAKT